MAGTFGSLSTALSSLYAQRRGLEVAGQNIANANTDGYSRQRLGLASVGAPIRPAIFAVGDPAAGGVTTTDLTRIRDEFLEARGRAERASDAYLSGRRDIFARVEQAVGEPSDTGLQSQFSDFWKSWHQLTNRPGDSASRSELLERGATLSAGIRDAYDSMASLWDSSREQFDAYVNEINTVATTVAQLNESVVRTRMAGLPGNELADQRDQAVFRLAELIGGQTIARANGAVDVLIGGSSLVSGSNTRQLVAYGATQLVDQPADPVGLRWADTGLGAAVNDGSLASTFETLNATLPGLTTELDSIAEVLATTVNAQHQLGFDLNGTAGGDFFSGTTASTIGVAFTDPNLIAAASAAPVPPATNTLDGGNADAIAAIATSLTGPDLKYRQYVVDLGIVAQSVNRRAEIQNAITEDVDASRIAQSGVNLDEEMTNMIAYQRAYEAAAKVMGTIDSILDTLINGMGR